MTSAYRDLYINTCNMLFETYSKLIPPLMGIIEEKMPKDPDSSKVAYTAALRAKVLDCLRGLLPAGTLTNMGIYGNGRFFESLIHKLHCQPLVELQDIGKRMHEELSKVLPSFIRRSDVNHHTHRQYAAYHEAMLSEIKAVTEQNSHFAERNHEPGVSLIEYTEDAPCKVAGALLFAHSNHSLKELVHICQRLPDEEIARILDAACNARENRRQRSPRALEHAEFTFEITADFGVYRDLHKAPHVDSGTATAHL